MKVIKMAEFTPEEMEILKQAGGILGTMARAIEDGNVDDVGEPARSIVKALKEVAERI